MAAVLQVYVPVLREVLQDGREVSVYVSDPIRDRRVALRFIAERAPVAEGQRWDVLERRLEA